MRGTSSLNERQQECVEIVARSETPDHEVSAMPRDLVAAGAASAAPDVKPIDGIVITHPRWRGLSLHVFITDNPYVLSNRYRLPAGAQPLTAAVEARIDEALRREGQLWLSREHNATLLAPIALGSVTALAIPSSADHGDEATKVDERLWLGDEQRTVVYLRGGGEFMVLVVENGVLADVAVSTSLDLPAGGTALVHWPPTDIERLAKAYSGSLSAFAALCAEREIGLTRGEGPLVHVSDSPRDGYRGGGTSSSATINLDTGESSDHFHAHHAEAPDYDE